MGRRVVKGPAVTTAKPERSAGVVFANAAQDHRVELVELEGGRGLLTIEPADRIWDDGRLPEGLPRGAIVRVRPPAGASDESITALRESLRQAGAAAVRVLPRAPGDRLAVPDEERERRPGRTVRQVVMDRAEAAVTGDRDALKRALDQALSEVGL